ncbi:Small subunit (SSU) processome component [Thecaphora frezii]
MAKNSKPQKAAKAAKGSTSSLNQPILPSSGAAAASTASCSFSPAPDHALFAHISNQVHQQRLKVFNASASAAEQTQLVTDYLLQQNGATCLASRWVRINSSASASPSKASKKRKQSQNGTLHTEEASSTASQLLLVLGLSSGQIHLFSPSLAKAVAIFDASSAAGSGSSAAANSGVVSLSYAEKEGILFACSKNGWVSSFSTQNLQTGADATPIKPVSSFRPDQKSAVQAVSCLGNHLLAAHHSITLVDTSSPSGKAKATFTGHASPVTHLKWISGDSFVSAAEGDRVIYVWSWDATNTGRAAQGKPVATVALDAPVRCISISKQPVAGAASSRSGTEGEQRLLILIVTQSGSVRIYGLPDASATAQPGKKSKTSVVPALELVSQIEGTNSETEWLDGKFLPMRGSPSGGVVDRLRLARLVRGAKVVVEDLAILDPKTGHVRKTIEFARTSGTKTISANGGLLSASADEAQLTGGSAQTQRYVEPPARTSSAADVATASLRDAGLVGDDTAPVASVVGDEPTLAQRLDGLGFREQGDDDDEETSGQRRSAGGLVSEASLWSSLSQALHSGDNSLLTSCLNHNDAGLIRATVRGISGPLAVKLLEECVARLNGAGGSNVSKGTIGSQRARALIEWIRATLLIHMGYLMSLPHLVSRMSSLHSTLSSRIATHERLLSLNGRLELVLSQIEARAAYVEQAAARNGRAPQVQGVKFDQQRSKAAQRSDKAVVDERARREGKKWVEESDDEDDVQGMDVDESGMVVRGDEDEDSDAEIQDITLGAEHDEDDEDDSDDEDEIVVRRRKSRGKASAADGNTSAESGDEDDEDDEDDDDDEGEEEEDEGDEEDEDEDEDDEDDEEDESDLEAEGASDLEDDEEDDEDDSEGGGNGMFDLEAEEGTDEEDDDE